MSAAEERLIDWTGERCVPWAPEPSMIYEHFHRYLWAARLLAGRRVLDLGSGEGFGAAILAQSAAEVTGVDVDPQAVEHSSLNYRRANLRFQHGSALDLSAFESRRFDAVIAFEMIEHVSDHVRVLSEIERVLDEDGILLISTPDRDFYSEASGQENPFHEHELSLQEFRDLLGTRFGHVALWGQRTITGSHLHALGGGLSEGRSSEGEDFFVEHSGEEWKITAEPTPLFCVAIASRVPLPPVAAHSTLADPGLELTHHLEQAHAAQVAERDRLLSVANRELAVKREEVLTVHDTLVATVADLDGTREALIAATRKNELVEQSVSWQTFQRAKRALYRTIGEDSRVARALGAALRLLGRTAARD